MEKEASIKSWISLILRLAFVFLFLGATVENFVNGLDAMLTSFTEMFKDTWLPAPLVVLHARVIPWVEMVLTVWLLLGIRLKEAWIVTALTLISLAFGMVVLKQSHIAANNFTYVFMACVGLYFSQYDKWNVGSLIKR